MPNKPQAKQNKNKPANSNPVKPLVSVKIYANEIVESWVPTHEVPEEFKLDENFIKLCLDFYLKCYLNTSSDTVKIMQKLAPEWKNHQEEVFSLCQKGADILYEKIQQCLELGKQIIDTSEEFEKSDFMYKLIREMILFEIYTVVKISPSGLLKYLPVEEVLKSRISRITS